MITTAGEEIFGNEISQLVLRITGRAVGKRRKASLKLTFLMIAYPKVTGV